MEDITYNEKQDSETDSVVAHHRTSMELKESLTEGGGHGPIKPFSLKEALSIIFYKRLYLVTMLTMCSMFFIITVI